MSLQNLSCKVLADLGRHGAAMAAEEMDHLAVEHETDLMLADPDCCRAMGERFFQEMYESGRPEALEALYLFLGQDLLRKVFDCCPMGEPMQPLVAAVRTFNTAAARDQMDGRADDEREAA
ncbi:hypothetical protein [Chromobacterium haemolyticum]|uniref:hypothetical protein n=1 Tax=Chromobacterium haemolyticum TaxID=394935 RepID=UPI0005BA824C|nr:hypothetical protein [Chromobacterium haemolyticum]